MISPAGWLGLRFGIGGGILPPAAAYSPAHVISQYLINVGVGTVPGEGDWPVYVAHEPDHADNQLTDVIVIYNPPGVVAGRWMTGRKVTYPGIQVRVRSFADPDGYAKAHQIAEAFDHAPVPVNVAMTDKNFRLDNISRSSTVAFAGVDEDTRLVYYTVNARVTLTPLEN
jgi:hypothetical protein